MKSTIVPAEITTIEDSITAKLNLTQVILLIIPIFLMAIIFAFIPPLMKLSLLKIVMSILVSVVISSLALRIGSRIVLNWLTLFLRYYLTPRVYLLSSPSLEYCHCFKITPNSLANKPEVKESLNTNLVLGPKLTIQEISNLNLVLNSAQTKYFSDKQGNLNVIIKN